MNPIDEYGKWPCMGSGCTGRLFGDWSICVHGTTGRVIELEEELAELRLLLIEYYDNGGVA